MAGRFVGMVPWIAWNLVLALIPAGLALLLFRGRARPNVLWWIGFVVLIAFLPNAPYVLTEVVHLPDQMRATPSDRVALFVVLPKFAIVFVVGFAAYAVAVLRLEGWLRSRGWSRRAVVVVDCCLHAGCAVGVFLGRVWRFNSWDLARRPGDVFGVVVRWFADPRPRAVTTMMLLAVVFAVGTMAARALAAGSRRALA